MAVITEFALIQTIIPYRLTNSKVMFNDLYVFDKFNSKIVFTPTFCYRKCI